LSRSKENKFCWWDSGENELESSSLYPFFAFGLYAEIIFSMREKIGEWNGYIQLSVQNQKDVKQSYTAVNYEGTSE